MSKIKKAGQDINQFMTKHEKAMKRVMQGATLAESALSKAPRGGPLAYGAALAVAGTQIKKGFDWRARQYEAAAAEKSAAMAEQAGHLRNVARTMREKKVKK